MVRLSCSFYFLVISLTVLLPECSLGQTKQHAYNAEQALEISQAAIGNTLENLEFTGTRGQTVKLADFRGKPLLISLVFTSCYHVCPALTRHLKLAVEAARKALGNDSFNVVTIGFDTANDSPARMQNFADEQDVKDPEWLFLSSSPATMEKLVANIGYVYFPTPRGFDHITQVTIINASGVIYQQVYGGVFKLPWLVEPLKELVFNRPQSADHFFSAVYDKVHLFCTVYDPNTGQYRIDYSIFIQIAIGALAIMGILSYLLLEKRRARNKRQGT